MHYCVVLHSMQYIVQDYSVAPDLLEAEAITAVEAAQYQRLH